jgi:putative resolvase
VSSHDQKAGLDRRVAKIAEWATRSRVKVERYVREIGSGLTDQRRERAGLLPALW